MLRQRVRLELQLLRACEALEQSWERQEQQQRSQVEEDGQRQERQQQAQLSSMKEQHEHQCLVQQQLRRPELQQLWQRQATLEAQQQRRALWPQATSATRQELVLVPQER